MLLQVLPLVFVLAGLALYVVLAGADFGAGIWQLLAGPRRARRADPRARPPLDGAGVGGQPRVADLRADGHLDRLSRSFFGSIASTLSVPLFIAAVGIILRGASYALRSGTERRREPRGVDRAFAVASLITPFALGAAVGGIASERVPVGNAAGNLFTSWLNPTSILIGVLAVASSAYLAAVYLAADAVRTGDPELVALVPRARAGRRAWSPARSRSAAWSCCTPTPTGCSSS